MVREDCYNLQELNDLFPRVSSIQDKLQEIDRRLVAVEEYFDKLAELQEIVDKLNIREECDKALATKRIKYNERPDPRDEFFCSLISGMLHKFCKLEYKGN